MGQQRWLLVRRKLCVSHISAAGKILHFMTRVKSLPQHLGQNVVVNFATYTLVYTVIWLIQRDTTHRGDSFIVVAAATK